jgi:hypothetical protein
MPHNQGKLVEAEVCYCSALDLDRDDPGATHLLRVVAAATGRLAQAADLLVQLRLMRPATATRAPAQYGWRLWPA